MPESSTLRIVLFGLPEAGKSALLGALAQAAAAQEQVLGGRLVDVARGLTELQRQLYDGKPTETAEETVSYPVSLTGGPNGLAPLNAVLVDCSGLATAEMVAQPDALRTDGLLPRALLQADTLVLAIDASASAPRLERDFGEFERFLENLERNRGQRTDIGGLPVFLVLTKCDLLAQAQDSAVAWIDRIEERKREVGRRFRELLGRPATSEALPFGSIDLHLWATAVKRPHLAEAPARPREPFGVAELFRQCLESAGAFHQRTAQAGRRLRGILLSSLAVLLILAGLAGGFALIPGEPELSSFERQVEQLLVRDKEQTPAERYRQVDHKIAQLRALQKEEAYKTLPPTQCEEVNRLLKKLTTYREFYGEFLKQLMATRQPREATSEKQLLEIETELAKLKEGLSMLQVPDEYRDEWSEAPLARLPDQWLKDIAVLRRQVAAAVQWYNALADEGKQIIEQHLRDKLVFTVARQRAQQFLDQPRNPPFPINNPELKLPGASRVTYATIYQFEDVQRARRNWEEVEKQLAGEFKLEKKP